MRTLLFTVLLLSGLAVAGAPDGGSSDNSLVAAAESPAAPPEATPPGAETTPAEVVEGDADVEATDYGTFNLNARDIELTQILEMLSEVSRRNILAGRDVTATVSVNLYDVTFDEALAAVLEVADCASLEEGNFIYVHPKEHVETVLKARRQMRSRAIELFYLSATDGKEIVTPMLSEGGTVIALGDVENGIDATSENAGSDSWAYAARLIVNDYDSQLDAIAEMLRELDMPPTQVQVEAAILQAKVSEKNAFGVDFSFVTSLNFSDLINPVDSVLGGPLTAVNHLFDAQTNSPNNAIAGSGHNMGSPKEPSTFSLGIIKDPFAIFLRMLDDVTDTTLLARPKVLCLNRQRARIHVGNDVGYLTTTQTETSTTQTQEFIPTGIELSFRPFIAPDGMIRMELNPSLSSAHENKVHGLSGQLVSVMDKSTNNITTNVRVRDGETIVLGGFFQEQNVISRKQVPGLSDIPVLGNAFQGQDDKIDRVEIIFLLTPRIVKDEELYELGQESLEIIDTVRVGVRSGLLPWSRDKMTANYNRDALTAYRSGELDLALYYANASLRQDLGQPEMHRFREQLTGERTRSWERNIGRRILLREMSVIPADELDPIDPVEHFDGERPAPEPAVPPGSSEAEEAAAADSPASTLSAGLSSLTFGEGSDQ
jgi:type IV pilus assembly protein PilQ